MTKLADKPGMSERRACRVLNQPRSSQRRQAKRRDDEAALVKRMLELVRERPRFGYRQIAALLRQEGFRASETRMLRLWRREGLKVPQKKRKRRALGTSEASVLARPAPNDVWCWDFTFERTIAGSPLKWLAQIGVETLYVEPGSPWQNGYAESFHSRLRDEFLALEQFESLAAARKLTAKWKDDYNHYRPHGSLGYVAPAAFAARRAASSEIGDALTAC